MSKRQFGAAPKPFALVSLPDEEPQRKVATYHERFREFTGQLQLVFYVVSKYLFVGSGEYEFDPNARGDRPDVWHTFYRRNDKICILGSSIKGVIRSILEAISNSCVSQGHVSEKDSHQPCQFRDLSTPLCPACRLFGTTGYRGRVHFEDANPQGDVKTQVVKIAELFQPKRCGPNKRRFYQHKTFQPLPNQRPEKNFRFVEALPEGTGFEVTLSFENLSQAELGLVFHALGWQARQEGFNLTFTPKLGGAKPRCFGAVRFEPQRLKLWHSSNWRTLLAPETLEGDSLKRFLCECLRACQQDVTLFNHYSWQALVEGLRPQSDSCPGGVY